MSFNIDPELAKVCYEDACRRLEDLEQKRAEFIKLGLPTIHIDNMIRRVTEERDGCAYYCK